MANKKQNGKSKKGKGGNNGGGHKGPVAPRNCAQQEELGRARKRAKHAEIAARRAARKQALREGRLDDVESRPTRDLPMLRQDRRPVIRTPERRQPWKEPTANKRSALILIRAMVTRLLEARGYFFAEPIITGSSEEAGRINGQIFCHLDRGCQVAAGDSRPRFTDNPCPVVPKALEDEIVCLVLQDNQGRWKAVCWGFGRDWNAAEEHLVQRYIYRCTEHRQGQPPRVMVQSWDKREIALVLDRAQPKGRLAWERRRGNTWWVPCDPPRLPDLRTEQGQEEPETLRLVAGGKS